jgi:molecular chaperone DnaK
MNDSINYGIDLGTTNSLIAKFSNGSVEIFRNSSGLKETLPSVVAFRKERIIVGDKAKEYVEKDPANVFSGFKRKMGTGEQFFAADIGAFKSPVDLSAMVLKELKNFIYTGEAPDAAVITIPASFDTIQSNATKEAGYLAGFKEVVLLQEPIAASLAFANKRDDRDELAGQWLVYDLGGGTYDVALVRFQEDELRVTDHEGDNYLGGLDFDTAIIEHIVVPELVKTGRFPGIGKGLRGAGNRYNRLYYILLHKAEEAKIELSIRSETEIEFEIEDENGEEHELSITVTRAAFEACIRPQIEYSIALIKKLLEKNKLAAQDVTEIILIGGSTYIPLVRELVAAELGITVNCTVDPTTAVAVGAAYFAGTRRRQAPATTAAPVGYQAIDLQCRTAFAKTSRESEEYFAASFSGSTLSRALSYRIRRLDGGYDSGQKPLAERISEMLPLVPFAANSFKLEVLDEAGNALPVMIPAIEISHGKFSIQGQPLPDDICIEVDDILHKTTKLELIFEKNNILPLRKTIIREAGKIVRRETDDRIIINVLEGSRFALPASNLPIGIIEIKGADLQQDLVKGSDIEIVLEINESRDLKVTATLLMNDQEFTNVFVPTVRQVSPERMRGELKDLLYEARLQMNDAQRHEHYELAAQLQQITEKLTAAYDRAAGIADDDVTDEKYQLEERKRSIAKELDSLGRHVHLNDVIDEYLEERDYTRSLLQDRGDTLRIERFEKIIAHEDNYLAAQSLHVLRGKIRELRSLSWEIRKTDPVSLAGLHHYYNGLPDDYFSDPKAARHFIELADKALERQNYSELLALIYKIDRLLVDRNAKDQFFGTGLS